MKKILYILLLSLFLFSCSEEEVLVEKTKQDFFVETKKINDFSKSLYLEKTGKISSSQDIKLTSQVSGRVGKVYVKIGEEVRQGDIIAKLEDNIASYSLSLERAKNTLDKAKINYESTKNQLNKTISDLKINLDNSKINLDNSKINIDSSKINLDNLKIEDNNSKASLELEKIDNSIKKLSFDYENLKTSNIQVINGFKNSLGKDLISFSTFVDDIIDFSDKILGVSTKNKNYNDSFEIYLGAKNTSQKNVSEDILRNLISYRQDKLSNVNYNFEGINGFNANLLIIEDGYSIISSLLKNLEDTLDNSIPSIGSLLESTIISYKGNISSFWISFNGHNSGFVSIKNSINSFLETYKNSEESLLKQIGLLESDKKIYIKGLDIKLEVDDSKLKIDESTLKINESILKINESSLVEAIKNRELTLKQFDILIRDAEIGYKQALNNYEKLTITSPISGVIGEVLIDEGQEVGPGSQLFNISNNSSKEIIISFSKDELGFIEVEDKAIVESDNITYTGSIYSISNIADSNLKYISRIGFNKGVDFIGDIVNVNIPFSTDSKLLPINIIKIDSLGKGIINILVDGNIEQKSIEIGKIYSDKVEILEEIDPELLIIITNIDNFDTNKFNLKLK